MSENVSLTKGRNLNDVAMELTELWYKVSPVPETEEELANTYKGFFKAACDARSGK